MTTFDNSSELLRRAQAGDADATDELLEGHAARLRRWATGRLPRWARGLLDTGDLVQEALCQTVRRLGAIRPEHAGGLEAYLRAAVLNRIRDEMRKVSSRPTAFELDESRASTAPSPLQLAIDRETVTRYEQALLTLRPVDRKAVIAHLELGYNHAEVAALLGKPTTNAARMALQRALIRLAEQMNRGE